MRVILTVLLLTISLAGFTHAADVDALIAQADALDEKNKNAEALEIYLQVEPQRPNDADVLRKIAKQYSQLLTDALDRAEKIRLGKASLDYAQRAVQADPKNSEARVGLAICYGRVAFFESPKTRIEYSKNIRSEAEAAVKLNPKNDYGWHVLGRWNYELATFNPMLRAIAQAIYGRFPDASLEAAAEAFETAIKVGPSRVIHHVELGRTYLALGRKDEARAQLEKGLSLPSREKDDAESKDRARKALASM